MTGLGWFLVIGATWRLTMLLVADEITRPARAAILRCWGDNDRLDYLLGCPWCASLWVAPVVTASGIAWAGSTWWQLIAGSLGVSALVGFLSAFASPDG